ncbi:hypothetical protein INR49_007241 [Caranx melampygus]|nr:hypothetical protein INR49_007241 [Caranx melampygus]
MPFNKDDCGVRLSSITPPHLTSSFSSACRVVQSDNTVFNKTVTVRPKPPHSILSLPSPLICTTQSLFSASLEWAVSKCWVLTMYRPRASSPELEQSAGQTGFLGAGRRFSSDRSHQFPLVGLT